MFLRGWRVSLALDEAELVLKWQHGKSWFCWSWDGSWRVSVWPGHEDQVKMLYYSVFKTHPGIYDGFNETKHFEKTLILPETKM